MRGVRLFWIFLLFCSTSRATCDLSTAWELKTVLHPRLANTSFYDEIFKPYFKYWSIEALDQLNLNTLQRLKKLSHADLADAHPIVHLAPPRIGVLSIDSVTAQHIYKQLNHYPFFNISNLIHYDPRSHYGFCYLRAMAIHYESVMMGILDQSVVKIWAVGDLEDGWNHHVGSAIKGTKQGQWHVFDFSASQVLSPHDWYMFIKRKFGNQGHNKVALFVTPGLRLLNDPPVFYSPKLFQKPLFRKFFGDMLKAYALNNQVPLSGNQLTASEAEILWVRSYLNSRYHVNFDYSFLKEIAFKRKQVILGP